MAGDPPSHNFIYQQVKERLASPEWPRDQRIDLQAIADDHRVSVTPIREIMFRLIGERLVEPFEFGGFKPRLPDASALQHLYGWYGHHLLAAAHLLPDPVIRHVVSPFAGASHGSADPVSAFERLSVAIGVATGNREFADEIAAANDRLRRPRAAERRLFNDLDREWRSIVKVNGFDVRNNVRRRLTAYHRRRIEAAPQLAVLIG